MNRFSPPRIARLLAVVGLCTFAALLAGCGGGNFSSSPPPPASAAIAFVTPSPDATVEVGKILTIKLAISRRATLSGIHVVGQGRLGTVEVPTKPPYKATLEIPSNLAPGNYGLTAVGHGATSGNPLTTTTVVRVVPDPTKPIPLELPQGALTFEAIGERLPITVSGRRPKVFKYVSAAPAIATVSAAGIVTAKKTGNTTIRVSRIILKFNGPPGNSFVGSVPVHVLAPALVPSATHLEFGKQAPGTTSPAQSVTLTNNAAYPVSILAVNSGTVFPASGNCKSSSPLAPGASCTINISYAPTATTAVTGALAITDTAVVAPTRILLSGDGS